MWIVRTDGTQYDEEKSFIRWTDPDGTLCSDFVMMMYECCNVCWDAAYLM